MVQTYFKTKTALNTNYFCTYKCMKIFSYLLANDILKLLIELMFLFSRFIHFIIIFLICSLHKLHYDNF